MKKIVKIKLFIICVIITMVTMPGLLGQDFISLVEWDELTLNQEQTTRLNKVSNYFGADYVTKIEISPISSVLNNKITIDIPSSNYPVSIFKGKHVEYESEDNYSWYGDIDVPFEDSCNNVRHGNIFIIAKGGEIFGEIRIEDEYYSIEDIGGKNLLLNHPSSGDGICGGAIDSGAEDGNDSVEGARIRNTNCEIKTLVLYTSAAKDKVNSISNLIETSIITTNQAFYNSSLTSCDFSLELVAYEEIDIDESLKSFTEILTTELQSNPVANSRRDFHDADIVILMVDRIIMNGGSTRGISFLGPQHSLAYAVVDVSSANSDYTFPHEVGHIIGGRHEPCDAEDAESNCDDSGTFEHAHTWSYKTGCWPFKKDHKRKTIMYSKVSSNQILNYSNPSIKEDGRNTGIVDERDNYKKIDQNACAVSNFRTQTDNLSINIQGPNRMCPTEIINLTSVVGGTPGPYTYEWKISILSGTNWSSVPVFSTNSQVSINPFSFNLSIGDVMYVRLEVVSSNGDTTTDYHSVEVSEHEEFGCPHSSLLKEFKSYLKVYPNPSRASTMLGFSVLIESEVEINIYDLNGKIVKSIVKGSLPIGYYQESIDFSRMVNSIYFIELVKGKEVERVPFVLLN